MRIEYEIIKVEEVEGVIEVEENVSVTCPLCAGYVFTVTFETGHHVCLHCQKCYAVIHLKSVT